jgi:hypothetical protein
MLFPFRISLTAKNNKYELEAIPNLKVTNCSLSILVSCQQLNTIAQLLATRDFVL